jgi:hypothetical protein
VSRKLPDRRVLLGAIVVLAAVVRLAGIGDRLSADEGYSWLVASSPSANVFLDRLAAFENTPPLFYLVLSWLPDTDEVWLRLPSYLASVACVPVLYAIVRPLLGTRVALLSALALAVAPYHVSFANYSRAFMLASLGLLLALWAAARLAQGGPRRWWALYVAGASIAYWSEYDSRLFLSALALAMLVIGTPRRREVVAFSLGTAALYLPWLHQARRSLDALNHSKVAPHYPAPTPNGIRDTLVPLFFGEHGTAASGVLRWLQFLALAAGLAWGALELWRLGGDDAPRIQEPPKGAGPWEAIGFWLRARGRPGFFLFPVAAVVVLAGHAAATVVGPDIFAQRYLTAVIPLGCVVLACAVTQLRWAPAVPAVAAALVVLGAAVFVTRTGRELEPDPRPVAAYLAQHAGRRPVLTNSAVVKYYLRSRRPRLDRPFGLGRGLDSACAPPHCDAAFAVVDDARVAGGPRPGQGRRASYGPLSVRLEPEVRGSRAVPSGRGPDEAGDGVNALACALAALVASSVGAPGARPLEVTVQDDALFLHRPPAEVARTARSLRSIGADRVRLTAGWSALAPGATARRRPRFDATNPAAYPADGFRRLDTAVKAARAVGLDVQVDVAFWAPRWAVRRGTAGDRQRWAPDPVEFGRFAAAVAKRYSGGYPDPTSPKKKLPAVRLWTTWNEPNHPAFLLPQSERGRDGRWRATSPHVYRAMHETAYDSIKAVSADNQVLIGGLAAFGAHRPGPARGIDPLPFTRALACVDDRLEPLRSRDCRDFKPLRADGFAIHPYSPTSAPDVSNPDPGTVQIGDLDRLSNLLAELRKRGRTAQDLPLYVTEYGYETNPPDPRRGVPPDVQARWHGLATWLAWKQPDNRMFAQFLLQDLGPDPRYGSGSPRRWQNYQTGLLTYRGEEKPALEAFKLPFWAEARVVDGTPAVIAFGQVRPGDDPQRVAIEAQGGDGVWRPIGSFDSRASKEGCHDDVTDFLTDPNGFYLRTLPYQGVIAYRPRWTRTDGKFEWGEPVAVGAPLPEANPVAP